MNPTTLQDALALVRGLDDTRPLSTLRAAADQLRAFAVRATLTAAERYQLEGAQTALASEILNHPQRPARRPRAGRRPASDYAMVF